MTKAHLIMAVLLLALVSAAAYPFMMALVQDMRAISAMD